MTLTLLIIAELALRTSSANYDQYKVRNVVPSVLRARAVLATLAKLLILAAQEKASRPLAFDLGTGGYHIRKISMPNSEPRNLCSGSAEDLVGF